jgi:cytochrome c-type biogenesis protein CcmH/NrfF
VPAGVSSSCDIVSRRFAVASGARAAILVAMRFLAGLVVAIAVVGSAHAGVARSVDEESRAIFHEYMSPYCPGLLLADCSSRPASTLRTEIRSALAAGTPAAEVRAGLERRFGEAILAAPPRRGFGLVAWLAPYVAVVVACALVVAWYRRRVRARMVAAAPAPLPVDPALRARLEAELRRF